MRKFLAVLLSIACVLGLVSVNVTDTKAAGYEKEDVYVLNYSADNDIEGYENFDSKRFYYSPYRTDIYITSQDGTKENWNWCSASVLNMINTSKIDKTKQATEPYASIPVYCVDAITDAKAGYEYRRVNLEESGYFDDNIAGRLRAIITYSFPHISDMSVIETAVNSWITKNNLGEKYNKVENLNFYEVISATQSVIWTLTNNGYLADDAYAGFDSGKAVAQAANCIYPYESGTYLPTDNTKNNINAVARYLEALAPMAATEPLVSESSFGTGEAKHMKESDGTYTVTVTIPVTALVDDSTDDLRLTAVCGEQASESVAVKNGTNEYTLVIKGVTAPEEVTVNIDGKQTAADVFFFDPLNGRKNSQSMAGYDDSTLPVHAEKTLEVGVGGISVTKKIGMIDFELFEIVDVVAEDVTYYVGIFTEGEDGGFQPYGAEPVKEIHIKGASSGTVEFTNLPAGTYYIFETDKDGNIIEYDTSSDEIYTCQLADGFSEKVVISADDPEGAVELINVYMDFPDGFYIAGQIDISKKVLVNDKETTVEDTFYAAVFETETATEPLSEVVELVQGGTVTIKDLPIMSEDEATVYYVFETDADGNKVGEGFAYKVTGEGAVSIDTQNTSGKVELENSKSDTPDDPEKENKPDKSDKDKADSVDTGDSANILFYMVIAIMALICIMVIIRRRRS